MPTTFLFFFFLVSKNRLLQFRIKCARVHSFGWSADRLKYSTIKVWPASINTLKTQTNCTENSYPRIVYDWKPHRKILQSLMQSDRMHNFRCMEKKLLHCCEPHSGGGGGSTNNKKFVFISFKIFAETQQFQFVFIQKRHFSVSFIVPRHRIQIDERKAHTKNNIKNNINFQRHWERQGIKKTYFDPELIDRHLFFGRCHRFFPVVVYLVLSQTDSRVCLCVYRSYREWTIFFSTLVVRTNLHPFSKMPDDGSKQGEPSIFVLLTKPNDWMRARCIFGFSRHQTGWGWGYSFVCFLFR